MNEVKINHEYVECQCLDSEHTLRFSIDDDPEWSFAYLSVSLNQHNPLWKRCLIALKYIFNIRGRHEHDDFDTLLFRNEDTDRIIEIFQKIKEIKKNERS